jgi:hypothetical protein
MYISPDFSLKTTHTYILCGSPAQEDFEKTNPRLNIVKIKFLYCIFLTKREVNVKTEIRVIYVALSRHQGRYASRSLSLRDFSVSPGTRVWKPDRDGWGDMLKSGLS